MNELRATERVDTVLKASSFATDNLPQMAAYLLEKFLDDSVDEKGRPVVSVKEKTGILRLFMSMSQSTELLRAQLGIRQVGGPGGAGPKHENPLIAILGGKVDIRTATKEQIDQALLAAIRGEETPAQVIDVPGSSNGRIPDSDPGDVGSSPTPGTSEVVGHGT